MNFNHLSNFLLMHSCRQGCLYTCFCCPKYIYAICDVCFLKAVDLPCSLQNRILSHQCWPRPAGCSDPQDRKVGMGKRGGYTSSLRYTNVLWLLLFLSDSFLRMIESSTIERYSDQPELFKCIKSLSVDTLAQPPNYYQRNLLKFHPTSY